MPVPVSSSVVPDISSLYQCPASVLASLEWPLGLPSKSPSHSRRLFWLQYHIRKFQECKSRAVAFNRKLLHLLRTVPISWSQCRNPPADFGFFAQERSEALKQAKFHQGHIKRIQSELGVSSFVVEQVAEVRAGFLGGAEGYGAISFTGL